ncbi:Arabidopsis Toxicos en Levadura 66 [Hibiscus trionum]|uniref:RING-type E3 ubiquitin transferase n=1 Tax=Hibiscus trionum TaxID=183268 RepID=A0A9W7MG88_HIBTR|nr:Arabidopsis Toxicos en Levadura 66 [Hibiscus trionum]
MASTKIFQWDFTLLSHTNIHSHTRGLLLLLLFFSLVIFIATFFLCTYWLFGRCLLSTAAGATPATSLGLDPHTINSLPTILNTKSEGKVHGCIRETGCSICLGVFEDEEMLKILPPCDHAFHSVCVDKWLGSQSSCPLCRACLTSISNSLAD